MNKVELKGHWHEIKGKLKQQWGELTDDDLIYTEGQEEQLIGRIQQRTGRRREEIQKTLEDLTQQYGRR